jgi:cobalt/nickel transport system permease protein
MEPRYIVLNLPPYTLLPIAGGIVLGVFILVRALKTSRTKRAGEESDAVRDWSMPAIDSHAHIDSLFHRWDPRIKISSLLAYVFCVASLSRLSTALAALLLAIVSVIITRIPWHRPLRRLAAMGGFLGMFLIVMPLTAPIKPDDTVIILRDLAFASFNVRGFLLAVLVCLKAVSIALMMEPLVGTSPLSTTMEALSRLGAPRQVCQMVLLAHRYIFVFHHEAQRMSTGMKVRGFRKRTNLETLRTLGNFIGMLLVRSFERTERVYEAMLSRGYGAATPSHISFAAGRTDWAKGAFWVIIGAALLIVDRLLKA